MEWLGNNILTLLSMGLMSIGGIFALIQWSSAKKLRRAEFVDKIINKTISDKDVLKAFSYIEMEIPWLTEEILEGKDLLSLDMDKMLACCDYICYLRETENIFEEEFTMMEFFVDSICSDDDIELFLFYLYHKREKTEDLKKLYPYRYVIEYGFKNKIIAERKFKDKNCKDIHAILAARLDKNR